MPLTKKNPSKVLYIGVDRCNRMHRCAVEVSYHTGKTITGAQFIQYLVDNFDNVAKSALIKEIKGGGE